MPHIKMRKQNNAVEDINEIKRILDESTFCTISMANNDEPYGAMVNFGYEEVGGEITIYIHGSYEGKKMEFIKLNNKAFFCAAGKHKYYEKTEPKPYATLLYESVTGCGEFEYIEDLDEKIRGLDIILKRYTNKFGTKDFPEAMIKHTAVLKMRLTSFIGKHNTL